MKLKTKTYIGVFSLSFFLAVAGIWSLYHFNMFEHGIQGIMDENYKSINASTKMLEALERQDSGILLMLLGNYSEGSKQLQESRLKFEEGFIITQNNITLPTEDSLISEISKNYKKFELMLLSVPNGQNADRTLSWYYDKPFTAFHELKSLVWQLISINESEMIDVSTSLITKANQAAMPGIISIFAALAFSLIFGYFVRVFLVGPIQTMIDTLNAYSKEGGYEKIKIRTGDELEVLADKINEISSKVKD